MSPDRNGNFTSSKIGLLMTEGRKAGSLGAPALSYIEELNMERRLGRALCDDVDARALSWGKLCEIRVFELLGLEYTLCSQETLSHPTISCWKGSPDAKCEGGKVAEIKCPKTLKAFCLSVDPYNDYENGIHYDALTIEAYRANLKEGKKGDKHYWQTVSNGILTYSDQGELIIYCPYQSELQAIRELAANFDGDKQFRYKWIADAPDDELPHLVDGGHYKNLNIISFPITDEIKAALTVQVINCSQLLTPQLVTV